MRLSEAMQEVRAGKVGKYILLGDEPFLKDRFVRLVRAVIPDTFVFRPDQLADVLSTMSTGDLFGGGRRAVVLVDFDKMKSPLLASLAEECPDTLVFLPSEKADMRTRALSTIAAVCKPIQCDKFKDYTNEYPSWIMSCIREEKRTASEEVCALIYHRVGANMFSLASELEKLFLVCPQEIATTDVVRYVSPTARATAFDVLDDLLRKDVKSALGRFSSYATGSDGPEDFVRFLAMYLEKMFRMLLLREQKFEADDIADIVGIPRYLAKTRYLPRAQGLGKSWFVDKLDRMVALQADLRKYSGNPRYLLDRFIFTFA